MKAKFINESKSFDDSYKSFDDVDFGDIGYDYHGTEVQIIDKIEVEFFEEDGKLIHDEYRFLSKYDSSYAMREHLTELISSNDVKDGDTINIVATKDVKSKDVNAYVYGEDGVLVKKPSKIDVMIEDLKYIIQKDFNKELSDLIGDERTELINKLGNYIKNY